MSLTLALNNALSGLNVNQFALSVLSNNIANANTPGYSRQIVDQSARLLGEQGSGVQIDDISRKIDTYLERSIQREKSNVGEADRIADFYQRIQILLGEPGAENSIDEYTENFFNGLQSLAENPQKVSFQVTAVNAAETLAREISGLATALEDLRYQADQEIQEAVTAINNELRNLDNLNVAINRAAALETPVAGLLDERDKAIETIAEYMDIEVFFEDSGAVNVFTANGVALVDEQIHELSYRPAPGVDSFIENDAVNPLQVLTFSEDGEQIREPDELISAGVEGGVTSRLESGSVQALQQLRDVLIPDILSQLDMLSSRLRDEVNALHNTGSAFPPAEELTGTREVRASEAFNWDGAVRIAALEPDGTPARSTYPDEQNTGYRPLELDFGELNGGFGEGIPTTQTIIDEINNHFNAPPIKAQVGNLNNVQIASQTAFLPQSPPIFNFDLDVENISATQADTFVTGVRVLDDGGADISGGGTGVNLNVPAVSVDQANAYTFTGGSNDVVIQTDGNHDFEAGDTIYLNPGPLQVNIGGTGVDSTDLEGYFQVASVGPGGNEFTITYTGPPAAGGGTFAASSDFDIFPPYQEVAAGEKTRTGENGNIAVDFTGNTASAFYDIEVTVGVFDNDPSNPQTSQSTVTYRVFNNSANLLNDRFDARGETNIAGNSGLVTPTTPHQYIFARMVDEQGNELPQINGSYGNQTGFLQLTANPLNGQDFTIAIDQLDSQQQGKLTTTPNEPGTNRGFSHYYELNNFFASNQPTDTGDSVDGSAVNLAVEQRLLDNPSLIATGNLQRSTQPADPAQAPLYTYERFAGDNSVAQDLAGLGIDAIQFDPAGGIPQNNISFNGYIGEVLGYTATQTVLSENRLADNESLLEGFTTRADAISGVNLDEELANTVIYQNAYTASARVITTTDELFNELLGIV